jgi:hypothetical protein
VIYRRRCDRQGSHREAQDGRWSLSRVHRSHHIFSKDGQAVPVPVHGSRDLGPNPALKLK